MSNDVFEEAYEAPTAEGSATGNIDELLTPLLQTKPWVMLCSILGLISAGLIIIVAIFMMIGMSAIFGSDADGFAGGVGVGVGFLYLIFAAISAIPPYWLYKYANAIKQADTSRTLEDVTHALRYQKSFWKFVGIFVAIYLGFLVLGLVITIIGGLFSSL
ncbi:hypothetical protein [Glaciecola petra]|uniref:DUF5362 domain-containing protein n=1 Tax=Glaciecola petra TaxID=3075602 RepID=A0ABU2ZVB5_9ALTE|nr:hypothetical protein [Aestuariibacter sp. P117]MDT0596345.1 hypothetical protein [Aestuariibacter sp. P117]